MEAIRIREAFVNLSTFTTTLPNGATSEQQDSALVGIWGSEGSLEGFINNLVIPPVMHNEVEYNGAIGPFNDWTGHVSMAPLTFETRDLRSSIASLGPAPVTLTVVELYNRFSILGVQLQRQYRFRGYFNNSEGAGFDRTSEYSMPVSFRVHVRIDGGLNAQGTAYDGFTSSAPTHGAARTGMPLVYCDIKNGDYTTCGDFAGATVVDHRRQFKLASGRS